MAKLSEEDVRHVAKLAKLELTSSEISKFQKQLLEVLDYMSELDAVQVDSVEPTAQTTGLINRTRKDETGSQQSLTAKDALSQAQKVHNDYFLVPRLIDKDDV